MRNRSSRISQLAEYASLKNTKMRLNLIKRRPSYHKVLLIIRVCKTRRHTVKIVDQISWSLEMSRNTPTALSMLNKFSSPIFNQVPKIINWHLIRSLISLLGTEIHNMVPLCHLLWWPGKALWRAMPLSIMARSLISSFKWTSINASCRRFHQIWLCQICTPLSNSITLKTAAFNS